jgi:hypothetical protein
MASTQNTRLRSGKLHRHGLEPNACVNLTNAGTFAEFAEEVRNDQWSDALFLPQYREPFRLRILENLF